MPRYLKEAAQEEAMRVWSEREPAPHQHTTWSHDFMFMARHDIACPICFDASARIIRDVTPGQYEQWVEPCDDCQAKGWRIARLPRWIRWLLRLNR